MRRLRGWLARLSGLLNKDRREQELSEELESHLQMHIEDNLRSGMTREAARRDALVKLGGLESIKESCRDQWGIPGLESLLQDLRFGLRMLRKNMGSTVMAALILALGIGGTTAIFSVADKMILRPFPGQNSQRLVVLREVDIMHDAKWQVSPPLFFELASYTNLFASLSAYYQGSEALTLDQGGTTLRLKGVKVLPGFFELLGVRPLAGRTFLPGEGGPGTADVLVLSYGMWQQQFGGAPDLIGRTITLDGRAFTVVGIMPSTFQFPFSPGENQYWLPHTFSENQRTDPEYRRDRMWSVLGRLRDSVSVEQAQATLDTIAQRWQQDDPEKDKKWIIAAQSAREVFVRPTLERTLWSLQAAVFMLLLISCANVGTLLVSRVSARRGELSVRMAIGAGRFRVVRQLLTESMMLAVLAGLLGVFFAWGGIRALDHFYLGNLHRLRAVGLDGSVLAITAMVSSLAGLVFGVAPACLVSRLHLSDSLKDASRQESGSYLQRAFQDGLMVLQVSLAVVLLAGAGLMLQSIVRLLRVDPGLDPKGLYRVWFDINPLLKNNGREGPNFKAAEKRGLSRKEAISEWWPEHIRQDLLWNESAVERLRAVPGIEAAAINGNSGGCYAYGDFRVEGRDDLVQLSCSTIGIRSGDYFSALRLPLLAGRLLTVQDCVPGQTAVVINQELARRCWPRQNPLGKRLFSANKEHPREYQVVGLVKDMRDWQKDMPQQPTFYEPIERETVYSDPGGDFVFRSNLHPGFLREFVTRLGHEMSPSVNVADFYSIEARLNTSTLPSRIYMWLLNTMGLLGLLLSALGIYAVLAYTVIRRTREIGIRMTLGATRSDIVRLLVGRTGRLVLNGMVLGLVAAFALTHYVSSLLYDMKPGDPWIYACVFLTLGGVAALACYLPARRALSINPTVALRYE